MSQQTRSSAGVMTRAMSSQKARESLPRVLRLGVLQPDAALTERIVRERANVSVGTTERATITVRDRDFPPHLELFILRNDRWHLRITPSAEGRVAAGDTIRPLTEWRDDPRALSADGDALLPLDDTSRGKISMAGVTVLFQFVPRPPDAPPPQVPIALRRSLSSDLDGRYNASLACFLALALGTLTWIEYGYDPIVDDDAELLELVSRRVRMSPFSETPPEPEPAAQSSDEASATTSDRPAPPSARPAAPRSHSDAPPRAPSVAQVAQMTARAEQAAARAARAAEASFGAITALTNGPHSAVDQLNRQVLMTGTADDLRNVGAITTRAPSSLSRTTAQATNLPGSQHLGQQRVVATPDGPGTGAPVRERDICRDCFTPERPAPETDTCDADAGAVARSLRGNLGGIRACYERAARSNPGLRGRLVIRFTVGDSGRATRVAVEGVDPALDQCVERAVTRMVFPPPTCGAADFEYPVTVTPAD